jgi:NADPH2:quinone reductase
MRLWRQHELGDPLAVLAIEEDDPPEAGPGQVVVRAVAVGLAFPDVLSCRGEYQIPTELPFTPGIETAGVVSELGDGVDTVAVGDSVLMTGGGLRELAVVAAGDVHVYPSDVLSPEKAAALPVNYCTTYLALFERAQVEPGETVLVTGAAGGTGTACIQLAHAAGADVIAVVGGDEKAELVRSLGAEHVIDHRRTPDWVDTVRELSGGGVEVAFDPVGGEAFHQVRRCMGFNGRLLVVGFVGGIPQAPMNHVLLKQYSIVGVHWGASLMYDPGAFRRQLDSIFDMARQGHVDPPLYPPFGFDQAAEALQALAERRLHGKAVVSMGQPDVVA